MPPAETIDQIERGDQALAKTPEINLLPRESRQIQLEGAKNEFARIGEQSAELVRKGDTLPPTEVSQTRDTYSVQDYMAQRPKDASSNIGKPIEDYTGPLTVVDADGKEVPAVSYPTDNGNSDQRPIIDYPVEQTGSKRFELGMQYQENANVDRSPAERLRDFVQASGKNAVDFATDPKAQQAYLQGQLDKLIGIGEGLHAAKEHTKGAVSEGWNALTDGRVAEFLSRPNAINDPLFKTIGATVDAIPKDPESAHKALESLGNALMYSSDEYSGLSDREKGRVIGETMFAMVNPEGSTEAGETAIKIADKVATSVDRKVWDAVDSATAGASDLKNRATEALKSLSDGGQLQPAHATAGSVGDNYFAMSKADNMGKSVPKRDVPTDQPEKPPEKTGDRISEEPLCPADYGFKRLTKEELGLENVQTFEARKSMKDGLLTVDLDYIYQPKDMPSPNMSRLVNRLKQLAKDEGASDLRVRGVEWNERLFDVMRRRHNSHLESDGITESVRIPLDK
jgi:hypothetical protein